MSEDYREKAKAFMLEREEAWRENARLREQVESLVQNTKSQAQTHDALIKKLQRSEEQVAVMRSALEFYSKLENYLAELKAPPIGFDFKHTPVHMDGGKIAKQALKQTEEK